MHRTIAVTTDLSQASREAFGIAVAVARRLEAHILFLHAEPDEDIVTPWQVPPSTSEKSRQCRKSHRRLREFLRDLPELAGVSFESCTLPGGTADSICEAVDRFHVQRLVMATHGHAGIQRFLYGSFTARLLQQYTVPVLVVRSAPLTLDSTLRAFAPEVILLPSDLSEVNRQACEAAHTWACAFGSRVRVVHVVDPELSHFELAASVGTDPPEGLEDLCAAAHRKLEELIHNELAGLPAEASVRTGEPTIEVALEAERARADLVILSSRALAARDRGELRSVAEGIIQTAPCPVLIVN